MPKNPFVGAVCGAGGGGKGGMIPRGSTNGGPSRCPLRGGTGKYGFLLVPRATMASISGGITFGRALFARWYSRTNGRSMSFRYLSSSSERMYSVTELKVLFLSASWNLRYSSTSLSVIGYSPMLPMVVWQGNTRKLVASQSGAVPLGSTGCIFCVKYWSSGPG